MSETLVGILGLITIVVIVWVLFNSKTVPSIAFVVFPSILAVILVAGGYFSIGNIGAMIKAGFNSTGPTAALFVFSVLYFGIMSDVGMFDVIIAKLMKLVGDNVVGVSVIAAVIALIGHLDGGGASTFCILIPAMLPVYKRMHMRPVALLRVAVLSMGVLNLMPWAGPTMRAASVLGIDASSLWATLIPIQAFGIVLAIAVAVITGFLEKKRGAGLHGKLAELEGEVIIEEAQASAVNELARPKLFLVNLLLTLIVIVMLIWAPFPSYLPFMLGVSVALFVNYGFDAKMHKKLIGLHSNAALMMCSTLMGAAVLMGVLTTSFTLNAKGVLVAASVKASADSLAVISVVRCIANLVQMILPTFLGQNLPIVIGILSVPLALAFDTDSYFYGMLPVIVGIGESFGVAALPIGVAMVVCRNCATFISPMVPATLLGTGLAQVDIKDHIKSNFLWVWGFSILCMIFAIFFGILPF